MTALATVFWGIVVLLVLVVVHELGHFIAARSFGVRVTEFMIGLPGPSIGFERNGCRYGVTAIPLGGYNRITGMEAGPEDPNLECVLAYVYRHGSVDAQHTALACEISEDEAELALAILDGWGSINAPGRSNKTEFYAAPKTPGYELGQAREVADPKALLDEERKHTYRALSYPKRLVVLFAGPLMNVVFAYLVLTTLFSGIGYMQVSTTLGSVVDGGGAQEAGLQAGDVITAVGGTQTPDWAAVSEAVSQATPGKRVEVAYTRGDEKKTAKVLVNTGETGKPALGIVGTLERTRLPLGETFGVSTNFLVMTIQGYASLINPATAADTLSQSSSVVGIAVMSEKAASAGPESLLSLMAVISLSLGIVNLLPIPPLDGGKIVVEVIQGISRREVPMRVINAITIFGIALFVLLFIVMLRQDILRFVLGG